MGADHAQSSRRAQTSSMRSGAILRRRLIGRSRLKQVVTTGAKTSHWIMNRGDKTIEWDPECSPMNLAKASLGARWR